MKIEKLYYDMDDKVSGLLKLEIDTERKSYNEIFYKQYHREGYWSKADVLSEILDLPDNGMIVTYNGRNWDLSYMIYRMKICDNDYIRKKIVSNDRDLMDTCLTRKMSIKGGLNKLIEDIGISIPLPGEEILVENKIKFDFDKQLLSNYIYCIEKLRKNHMECETIGPAAWSSTEYHTNKVKKPRNELGIRALPLVEEYLGLLYQQRIDEDRYRPSWMYQKAFSDKMGNSWKNWDE